MEKSVLLKCFMEKLLKRESLDTLSLIEIFKQADSEISKTEKVIVTTGITWNCSKCTQPFDYCWCNTGVH